MNSTTPPEDNTQFLSIFRDHVRAPIATAIQRVERERREVRLERQAFAAFASHVKEIPTLSVQVKSSGPTTFANSSPTNDDALREAYADTVMDVPHFDAVYGEAMGENLVAEFGGEFAQLFDGPTTATFSPTHKRALIDAAQTRVADREQFAETLNAELESLVSNREQVAAIIESLDSTSVPTWYSDEFTSTIDDVIADRLRTINSRPSLPQSSGHALCEYLYAEPTWSYPVLTAAGRLLDIVTVEG